VQKQLHSGAPFEKLSGKEDRGGTCEKNSAGSVLRKESNFFKDSLRVRGERPEKRKRICAHKTRASLTLPAGRIDTKREEMGKTRMAPLAL